MKYITFNEVKLYDDGYVYMITIDENTWYEYCYRNSLSPEYAMNGKYDNPTYEIHFAHYTNDELKKLYNYALRNGKDCLMYKVKIESSTIIHNKKTIMKI